MKKRISLIVSIICMIVSVSMIGGTVYYASHHQSVSVGESTNGTPPQMPGNSTGQGNNAGQPGDQQAGQNGQSSQDQSSTESQDQQGGQSANDSQSSKNSQNSQNGQDSSDNQNNQSQMPSQQNGMPSSNQGMNQSSSLSPLHIVIISIGSAMFMLALTYLIMSKAGTKSVAQTFSGTKPTAIYAIVNVIATIVLVFAIVLTSNAVLMNNTPTSNQSQITQIDSDGVVDVSDTKSMNNKTVSSSSSDQSVITVSDGGSLNASSLKLKKSGDTSNTENSEFYGLNAALLTQKESTTTIKDSTIETSASGANAVFSTGENAKINISNTTIKTTGDSSRGLDATYGGTINANKVTISTQGSHCAAIATDRGEGTITAKNSTLNTSGQGSPCIYSTGNITVKNSKGLATNSSCAVIEGKNSITLNNTKLVSYGIGRTSDGIDSCGVMIYQSMSGDASSGTGTFTAKDSTLSISKKSDLYTTSPMFFITNTQAVINLENTKLNYGSGTLLKVAGNSGEWGQQGSNGGTVTLNATHQSLTGNIVVDSISSATLSLKNSTLTGTVNQDQSAKEVNVSLDSSSSWKVTGDSYVTTLTLENNDLSLIQDQGHTIYYDSSANSWLNGQTITLSNGGILTPAK